MQSLTFSTRASPSPVHFAVVFMAVRAHAGRPCGLPPACRPCRFWWLARPCVWARLFLTDRVLPHADLAVSWGLHLHTTRPSVHSRSLLPVRLTAVGTVSWSSRPHAPPWRFFFFFARLPVPHARPPCLCFPAVSPSPPHRGHGLPPHADCTGSCGLRTHAFLDVAVSHGPRAPLTPRRPYFPVACSRIPGLHRHPMMLLCTRLDLSPSARFGKRQSQHA